MYNRELFYVDPTSFTIPNDGVTTIYTPHDENDWEVVRYELKSFVCEGEYYKGLERILSTFLANLGNPRQPAVWVSGFYGSGKSHLVRVLQYLWSDVELPDKARARSLVNLPQDIRELLKELSTAGKREGGLWSAAGKLTAAANESVRLGMLGILFQCANLPEQYHLARFVLWLKQKGYYRSVKDWVEAQGDNFEEELVNLYVSQSITDGLLQAYSGFANTPGEARKLLAANFQQKLDISDDEFLETVGDVLELQQQMAGKLPLTLIAFDELQQFIGDDPERTLQIQSVVESCSTRFGSRLLFIGTGQASLQSNPQLSKLVDRFGVRVMLEDSDVETVVRQVILRKLPDKIAHLQENLDINRAEIDRHLVGTQIAPSSADNAILAADYPLLPTRRRFWERVLRAIDIGGTAAQLRTQLRVIHEANRLVANRPIGTVVPADVIYEQQESSMLQSGVLLREVATIIRTQDTGTPDGKLKERLCSLVFMIGKLPTQGVAVTGIKANPETLADLLVEDLTQGSATLRQKIPTLLDQMTQQGILMKVDDEYRLQTAEGVRWEEDFRKRFTSIRANDTRVASDRNTEFQRAVNTALKGIALVQGVSKTPRKFELYFGMDAPKAGGNLVPIWIQDEWSVTEKGVREAAQSAGVENSTEFVLLPRYEADALRDALAAFNAAKEVLETHPTPTTPEGFEALRAMETRQVIERKKLDSLISLIIEKSRVFQGGGYEVIGNTFAEAIKTALDASLARLFPKFSMADNAGWGMVVARVQEGAVDALNAVGFVGSPNQNPVCQEISNYIGGAGKKGSEVRKNFVGAGYGWPQDAVDGALLVLLASDHLIASQNGQVKTAKQINQASISQTDFRLQGKPITIDQRIIIRGLLTGMKLAYKNGEEAEIIPVALQLLVDLANDAGGNPPLPEKPATFKIESLRSLTGNEQFAAVVDAHQELLKCFNAWTTAKEKKTQRLQRWNNLQRLQIHAVSLPNVGQISPQIQAILTGRSLLADPDPVIPLIDRLVEILRSTLQGAFQRYQNNYQEKITKLGSSEGWQKITEAQRQIILKQCGLVGISNPKVGTDEDLLISLDAQSLSAWDNLITALPARFDQALMQAASLLEPEAVKITPRSVTLHTVEEAEDYLSDLRQEILANIQENKPVIIT